MPYEFGDGNRSRFLGGSSNCWGGFCRPWDEEAFKTRDWVNASGWPIGRRELDPYYTRAHSVLKVPSENYRPEHWVGSIGSIGAAAHAQPSDAFSGTNVGCRSGDAGSAIGETEGASEARPSEKIQWIAPSGEPGRGAGRL